MIEIYNLEGQAVYKRNIAGTHPNLIRILDQKLPKGVYFIKIKSVEKDYQERLIIS